MSRSARTMKGRSMCLLAVVPALTLLGGAAFAADGQIATVAGGGRAVPGDGGPATAAQLDQPRGLALEPWGSYLIAEFTGQRVRRVAPDGTITTVAGTGVAGYSGDGGPATAAQLDEPTDVVAVPSGPYKGILIADELNHVVRRVDPAGIITTVAGVGVPGSGGGGGPAAAAGLRNPRGLAVTPDGGFLIADEFNNRVRKVGTNGLITTVAGTGGVGATGDGGPATAARLNRPLAVASIGQSDFLIADGYNNCIRYVSAGVIRTAAGQCGGGGFAGDGGLATAALLLHPRDILPAPNGCYFIVDSDNQRVRRVDSAGVISTVAGTGVAGFFGDGGPPASADLTQPSDVEPDSTGALLIADTGNGRIRRALLPPPAPPAEPVQNSAPSVAAPSVAPRPPISPSILHVGPPRVVLVAPRRVRTGGVLRVTVRTDRAVDPATIALQVRVRTRFVASAQRRMHGRSVTLQVPAGTHVGRLAIRAVLRAPGQVATSATRLVAVRRDPRCAKPPTRRARRGPC